MRGTASVPTVRPIARLAVAEGDRSPCRPLTRSCAAPSARDGAGARTVPSEYSIFPLVVRRAHAALAPVRRQPDGAGGLHLRAVALGRDRHLAVADGGDLHRRLRLEHRWFCF